MKKTNVLAGKIIFSGVIGIILFLAALFLYSSLVPSDPRHDVPEGFAAGFFMILAAAFSVFIAGALAIFLTFNDISSLKLAFIIPLLSGLVAAVVPLLMVIILGLFSLGLLIIGLAVIMISLLIAELGGLVVFMILSLMKALKKKTVKPSRHRKVSGCI
jgi:hypothetical protein